MQLTDLVCSPILWYSSRKSTPQLYELLRISNEDEWTLLRLRGVCYETATELCHARNSGDGVF